jgi:hypothetical protein
MKRIAFVTVVSVLAAACGGTGSNDLLGGSPRETQPVPGGPDATREGGTDAGGTDASRGGIDAADGASGTPDAAPIANAFTGAGAYTAITGPGTTKDEHPNGGNPAKADCMTSSCHGAGGEGPRFVAGGTVYKDVAGTMPAPQVEVRFLDGDGTALSVHTNDDGNFFVRANGAAANLSFPMKTGARDGTVTRLMASPIAVGSCNSTACHGGATGVIHVP